MSGGVSKPRDPPTRFKNILIIRKSIRLILAIGKEVSSALEKVVDARNLLN